MKFRTPANILLRRAQLVLMLAALVPTVLMLAAGTVLLIVGSGSIAVVIGALVLALCTTSLTGYILGSIFVSRGASMTRVQNDFLSSVSHELRTPLTSISLFIETLRDGRIEDPQEQRKCLDLLYGEVERLDQLVNRLLELSRIETGRQLMEREPVAAEDIVAEGVEAFRASTIGDPTEVDVDVTPGLVVTGDRAMLARAVTNLLINAWKYTSPEDRQIGVQARPYGEKRVELTVTDNGPGIPRGEQKAIFEKFERGRDAVDSQTGGMGLGLSIVRAIVRGHRGRVELRSKPGRGSEFRILLPRRRK